MTSAPQQAIILITGIQAAGKSTIAQILAERLPRSVHVRGDLFRRMVINGRADMTPDPSAEAVRQLRLRHRLIWNLASEHFPEATQIVDLYHTREHLHDLGKQLTFMLGDTSSEWLAERSADLDAGDIPALLSAARAFTLTGIKAAERDKALAYFETSAPRMRYSHFRSCGLFTGSGVVEAGCKSVIGQRLKLSGCTGQCPAQPASSPCAQHASGRWEEILPQPNNQTQPPDLTSQAS